VPIRSGGFIDPLTARIAAARAPGYTSPDTTQLSEQQLGLALARAVARRRPMSFVEANGIMYRRTKTNEIDFVSADIAIPYESKYGQTHWRQEALT
jgi:hypothetical protein